MTWDSAILGFFHHLYSILKSYYSHSFLAGLLKTIGSGFNRYMDGSAIISFVRREGFFSKTFRYSFIYNGLDKVLNLPTSALRNVYKRKDNIFEESYFIKFLNILAHNFYMLVATALVVILVVPDARWSNAYVTILTFALFLLFFYKCSTEKIDFNIKGISTYLLIFMLTVVLAQIFSIFPGLSLRFLIFYINCFLLFLLIVSSIRTTEQLEKFVGIVLIGVTATGLYGMLQAVIGVPVKPSEVDIVLNEGMPGRVYSTIGNSNSFAEILVMFLPFYMAAILNSKKIWRKLMFIALAVPPFLSLLLTYSRSSWIGFAVSAIVFAFFWKRKLLPLVIVAGVLCIPMLPQSIYRRILTIVNLNDTSTNYRILIYQTIWPALKDYWFTGIGLGTDSFKKILQNYALYTTAIPPHSHNVFVQLWMETGIIGILSYLAFLLGLVKSSVQSISKKGDPITRNYIIAGLSALIGICVVSMAEYVWFFHRVMIMFWVVTALIVAGVNISSSNE